MQSFIKANDATEYFSVVAAADQAAVNSLCPAKRSRSRTSALLLTPRLVRGVHLGAHNVGRIHA